MGPTRGRKKDKEAAAAAERAGRFCVDQAAQQCFFDLYERMIGRIDIPAVLRDVARIACQELQAERASIYLIDKDTEELVSVATIGNVARMIRVPIRPSSLAGFCAVTGRSFVVPDAYGDLGGIDPRLRFDRSWDELNHFRTRDVMCAPARFKGDVRGVVQVLNSRGRPFGAADLAPLENICRLIGYTLYHARLYDDLATLKRLEQEKARFMRVVVHELKSPVAAAQMMAAALRHCPAEPARISSLTTRIAGRLEQMNTLVKDILDLASVKEGNPLGQIAVLDLVPETEACCRQYREQAEQKGLTMETQWDAGPVPVRFDVRGYQLVLSNLASNAVKYTPAGTVRVILRRREPWAVLRVEDTGIGIPQGDIPQLFREFFRASNAKRARIPGSGVGLAGVKHLVERFGGRLTLESRENEGTCFTVHLPLHETQEGGVCQQLRC